MPFELLQVTAEYSNAVLLAVMPYVSDFAQKLFLPIPQPVSVAQVSRFNCSPLSDHIGGRVFLTNGYSFSFEHGAVVMFSSPSNYFGLQDPRQAPAFYGPVKVPQDGAVRIAKDALKRLGYTDAAVHFDSAPKITPPPRSAGKQVARYLIEWQEPLPERAKPISHGLWPGTSAEAEVDATSGQIHMLAILSKDAWRPDPKIGVHPPVLTGSPQDQLVGGTKVYPVSAAYARAFLAAILPQLSEYVKKTGVDVKLPITSRDLDLSACDCGLVRNDPNAILYLQTGDRFVYSHGQVTCFYARDSVEWSAPNKPHQDMPPERFYGPVKVQVEQALATARKALLELGYLSQIPQLRQPPQVVPPRKEGTNYFARYFFNWGSRADGDSAVAEVDASTGKLKSLLVDDLTHTNIWRQPPKIDVPMEVEMPQHQPPPSPPLQGPFALPPSSGPPPKLPRAP